MIGFTLGVELQFTGTLYLGEIVLALIAVVGVSVDVGNSKFWSRELYWLMIWLTVSYLAYIVTDIFVGTSMTNVLRGWGRMGFLMTDIVGVYVICRKNRYNLFPGKSGKWRGPQARRAIQCVLRGFPPVDLATVSHQYGYYAIAILAVYPAPDPFEILPTFDEVPRDEAPHDEPHR